MNKFINTILHYPKLVVLLFLSLACFSFFLTFNNLKIDTSTDSLINKNLDFKINQQRLKNEFKFLSNNSFSIILESQNIKTGFNLSVIGRTYTVIFHIYKSIRLYSINRIISCKTIALI